MSRYFVGIDATLGSNNCAAAVFKKDGPADHGRFVYFTRSIWVTRLIRIIAPLLGVPVLEETARP